MDYERQPLAWRKSSASGSGNCVEVAVTGETVLLRDTKDQGTGPVLAFTEAEWQAFLIGVGADEFSLETMREE